MSQVGALYVDVGVRGLSQAMSGLRALGDRLRNTGDQARNGLIGALKGAMSNVTGALGGVGRAAASIGSTIASGVTVAVGAIGSVAAAAGAATAALGGMAAAGVYALAALGRNEKAGESLKQITAAFDGLMTKIGEIILMIGELIATQTGIADGLDLVTQTLGELWEEWRPTIAAMIDTVATLFSTMWDAAKSAFDIIQNAFSGLMNFFGISLEITSETWAQTVKRWAEEFQFFVETFSLRIEILWERFKLFISNSIEYVKAFGKNIVVAIEWVWSNWREIFQTIGNFVITVFRNAGENIRRIWTSVTDWIRGKGWKPPDLKPLTEGFRSTIKEMPKWVEANTKESTERLDQLLDELERRRAVFRDRIAARDQRIAQKQLLTTVQPQQPQQQAVPQYGLVGFAELARRGQEDAVRRLAERQAKAAEVTAAGIMGLVDAARGPGLRVQVQGGIGARYE
jgi:hypothetical protein